MRLQQVLTIFAIVGATGILTACSIEQTGSNDTNTAAEGESGLQKTEQLSAAERQHSLPINRELSKLGNCGCLTYQIQKIDIVKEFGATGNHYVTPPGCTFAILYYSVRNDGSGAVNGDDRRIRLLIRTNDDTEFSPCDDQRGFNLAFEEKRKYSIDSGDILQPGVAVPGLILYEMPDVALSKSPALIIYQSGIPFFKVPLGERAVQEGTTENPEPTIQSEQKSKEPQQQDRSKPNEGSDPGGADSNDADSVTTEETDVRQRN